MFGRFETQRPKTVRRIMRDIKLFSRIKRKFVVTTNSEHVLSVAENLLNRDFTAYAPNRKWVADINAYLRLHDTHWRGEKC